MPRTARKEKPVLPRFRLIPWGASISALDGRLSVVTDLGVWRLWFYREPGIFLASLGPVHLAYSWRTSWLSN